MLLRSTGQTLTSIIMIIAHLRAAVTQIQRTVKSLKPSGPACVSPLDIPYFGAADKHSRPQGCLASCSQACEPARWAVGPVRVCPLVRARSGSDGILVHGRGDRQSPTQAQVRFITSYCV